MLTAAVPAQAEWNGNDIMFIQERRSQTQISVSKCWDARGGKTHPRPVPGSPLPEHMPRHTPRTPLPPFHRHTAHAMPRKPTPPRANRSPCTPHPLTNTPPTCHTRHALPHPHTCRANISTHATMTTYTQAPRVHRYTNTQRHVQMLATTPASLHTAARPTTLR